jgi:tripartite-type tricarboxylate transporter receptor subunit TctC
MQRWIAAGLLMTLLATPAGAQSAADFYRGKAMTLIVGYSAGGGYDTYARILARHIGKHIPGQPSVVVQNMPGAGSLRAANYLFNVAPKDGSVFGIFGRGIAVEPLIGSSPAQFDGTKFLWLGSGTEEAAIVVTWTPKGIRTWADMLSKPFTVGGEGTGSDPDVYALMLKNVFGVKLRLVSGYPGTAEMALAIERGEVDGRASWSWSSLKSFKPDWMPGRRSISRCNSTLHRAPICPACR